MENAKIGIFDDREDIRGLLKLLLEQEKHSVVVEAESVEDSAQKIDSLHPGDLDVALVDGNLGMASDLSEGAEIARLLREKMADVVIVGISSTGEPIEGVDENIDKMESGKIKEYISNL